MKKQVYLSGKVGGDKWKAVAHLKSEIDFYSSDGGESNGLHDWGVEALEYGDEKLKELVLTTSLLKIESSDALLAILTTPDSFGTIAEIAYASAKGVPSIVIIIDSATTLDHGKFSYDINIHDAYHFICAFPEVRTFVVRTCDEASVIATHLFLPQAVDLRSLKQAEDLEELEPYALFTIANDVPEDDFEM